MKIKTKNNLLSVIMLLLTVSFFSCKEEWDDHYNNTTVEKSNLNLYQFIKANQDSLSIFAKMIAIAGYDTILSEPQTFTVWAPLNSSLQNIDLTDTALVVKLAKNHIARYAYPTSVADSSYVLMVDSKLINYTRTKFGNANLVKSNNATKNGILHYIDNYVPYKSTILEYIRLAQGLDSLKAYLDSNEKLEFVPSLSTVIAYDANNRPVYDSVFIRTNKVLSRLGSLGVEDSVYTAILPGNAAWIEAYTRIKSFYNTLPRDWGGVTQRTYTNQALVNDLVFRGRINPSVIPGDSLISTGESVFYSPSYLFDGSQKVDLSNGYVYVSNQLRFKPLESWHKELRVEAEDANYGRSVENNDIIVKSSLGTSVSLSNNKYLQLEPNTTSSLSKVAVNFPIPYTLSAKYNIYCVFAPTNIVASTDLRPCKVRFYLSYIDATGKEIAKAPVIAVNGVNQVKTSGTPTVFQTDATSKTKMLVAQFQFPYSNLLISTTTSPIGNISVKLRVENATASSETVKYSRTMRIDCLILEPVE